MHRTTVVHGAILATLLAFGPAGALAGPQCEAPASGGGGGAVSLVVLASPEKVHTLARELPAVPVLRRGPATVVFADGRVVTSDVEAAGRHLNALGWAGRRIEVMASFPSRPAWRPG
ncbi:MAG: hypothetical protein QNK05_04970 [Myxococcota bacterium]|nr:hypothetical protein [Myxococcota bacterium]